MRLRDDDPQWNEHSGGSGHDGPEWAPGDEDKALAYWEALDDRGRAILRHLIRHRSQKIVHSDIVEALGLDPTGTKSPAHVMAGSLNGMHKGNEAAGRRFPFHWWEKDGGASYAVRTQTARIFDTALNAAEVAASRGEFLAFASPADHVWPLVRRLDARMVLGAACTTAHSAVHQFVAALQLPYEAASGWTEFLRHLGTGPAGRCIVVGDACELLKHETHDVWDELTKALLDGGRSTLVLTDAEAAWDGWVFRGFAGVRPRG